MGSNELKGLVIKSTGSWYKVLAEDNEVYDCKVRGKFRLKEGPKPTNPVAVGDKVTFTWDEVNQAGMITELTDRKNYIIRRASNLSKQVHIIAANIDHAIMVATVSHPRTSQGFIDRFLITAEAYDIPPVILFNKADLYEEEDAGLLNHFNELYKSLGYITHIISAKTGKNLEVVKHLLQGQVSLFAGHSGTGKTTILNKLYPDLELKTAEISTSSTKGKHTTTFAEMHRLDDNTFVIDTPGIREFGVIGFEPYEISHFFPELLELLPNCKFSNCLHVNEPGCAVIQAVEEGGVDKNRYKSYRNILSTIDEKSY